MTAADSLAWVEGTSYVTFSVIEIELNLFMLPLAAAFLKGKSLEISLHICLTSLLSSYFSFSLSLLSP